MKRIQVRLKATWFFFSSDHGLVNQVGMLHPLICGKTNHENSSNNNNNNNNNNNTKNWNCREIPISKSQKDKMLIYSSVSPNNKKYIKKIQIFSLFLIFRSFVFFFCFPFLHGLRWLYWRPQVIDFKKAKSMKNLHFRYLIPFGNWDIYLISGPKRCLTF